MLMPENWVLYDLVTKGHRLVKTGRLVGFFLLPELKNLVMKKGAVFEDTLLEY